MSKFNFNQPNVGTSEVRKAFAAIHAELLKVRLAGADPTNFNLLLTKLDAYFLAVNTTNTKLNTYFTNFNALLTKLDADAGVTDTNYSATLVLDVAGAGSFVDNDVDVAGAGSFSTDLAISGSAIGSLEFVP